MPRFLVLLAFGGCNIFSKSPPVILQDTGPETVDSGGGTVELPLGETRLRVMASFRYEASTGLPGPWLDESTGDSTSAILFIVGDDQFDGANGTFCVVNVPISPVGARLVDLDYDQFWGVTLQVDDKAVTTNCEELQYQRIWDFYAGELVEYLTTNRDGSPVEWAVIVEEPSASAVTWVTGGGSLIPAEQVIGGEIRLSDRAWPQKKVDAIATLAYETDSEGTLLTDKKGENIPILLADVFQNPGIKEGQYRFLGYQFVQVTNP